MSSLPPYTHTPDHVLPLALLVGHEQPHERRFSTLIVAAALPRLSLVGPIGQPVGSVTDGEVGHGGLGGLPTGVGRHAKVLALKQGKISATFVWGGVGGGGEAE